MRKAHIFLLALLLVGTLVFSSRVYGRLEFTIADSEGLGHVARFYPHMFGNSDCSNADEIENEELVKVRSGISDSLDIGGEGERNPVEIFLRIQANGSNQTLIYYKPRNAECYYWARTHEAFHPMAYVKYVPRGRQISNFNLLTRLDGLEITEMEITEYVPRGGRNRDDNRGFKFLVNGTSRGEGGLRFSALSGRLNRIGYGTGMGGMQGAGREYGAPFTSQEGNRFQSMGEDSVIFSMFLWNQ